MSTCLDCPKPVKASALRCFECNCKRQAEERREAARKATAQKKRTARQAAARALVEQRQREYEASLQPRLKAEAMKRMSRRAA